MRILTAIFALVTLTACGPGEDVEQRDPRCDYEDDREWVPLRARQTDTACARWYSYDPDTCQGQGCRVQCSQISADERQADYNAATLDMITSDYVDIMVNCGQPDESVDSFLCKGNARVLIGEEGCTTDTQMILTTIFTAETHEHVPGYSAVWQIPAE